ncbi:hypothetical protein LTR85_004930 [Meristemomyces frigidus]|nr:hypothetical protein LTR85_004930 [Meristemomyces frigidus]
MLRFTNAIANATIEIPAAVLELLADVISGRKVCADWYTAQVISSNGDASTTEESNKGHAHFLEVLQETYDVLKAARKRQKVAKWHSPPEKSADVEREAEAKESLPSLFAQLEVEEPSENPLGDEPSPTFQQQDEHEQQPEYHSLEVDDSAEKEFALWCFLEDLHEIRTYLRSIWSDYATGELSFMTASAVTDQAFGIMRRTERDLKTCYPAFDGLGSMSLDTSDALYPDSKTVAMLCPMAADTLSGALNIFTAWEGLSEADVERAQESWQTGIIGGRSGVAADGKVAQTERALSDGTPRPPDRQDMVNVLKVSYPYHGFSVALLSVLHEVVQALASHDSVGYPHDDFVQGFRQLLNAKEIPAWLLVACQLYMDLWDNIDAQLDFGAAELCKAVQAASTTERQYDQFLKSYKGPHLPKVTGVLKKRLAADRVVEQSLTRANHAKAQEGSKAFLEEEKTVTAGDPNWVANGAFEELPVSAGYSLYDHRMSIHYVTVEMTNFGTAVLSVAHLYRAARHYGLIESKWRDMEWLVDTHSKKHPLAMDVPPGADDLALCRRFEIALGIPPTVMLASRRNAHISFKEMGKRKDERRIQSGSDLIGAIAALGCARECGGGVTGEVLDEVLMALYSPQSKENNGRRTRQAISGIQLLKSFKDTTVSDEPQLHFDYLGFWMLCADLMGKLYKDVMHLLPKKFRPGVDQGPSLIIALFYEAVRYQRASRPLEQCALGAAVRILCECIGKYGENTFTKAAFEQSSGHIPKHMRPDLTGKKRTPASPAESVPDDEVLTAEKLEGQDGVVGEERPADTTGALDVREVFAARKRRGGRRLLRTRK